MKRAQITPAARAHEPHEPSSAALERARTLVLRFGWNATAYQILNRGIRLWFARGGDAVAGYVDHHGVRIAAGAPICAREQLIETVREFEGDAAAHGLEVCYLCAGSRLLGATADDGVHRPVIIGAQPAWDPVQWEEMLSCHASLRAQLNRARNKGVEVMEWPASFAAGRADLYRCLDEWLAGRGLPPLHFLVEPRTLDRLYDRRVFVALLGARPVGFLVASPIPARQGWLVEQIVRGGEAPNGTSELLIDAVVRTAELEGCHYITLGLSPLSNRAGAIGAGGPLWLRFTLNWTRAHVHRFYNFEGLESFKAKFRPAQWEPIYAISRGTEFTPRLLYAIASAFSDRSVPSTVGRALASAARQELAWVAARLTRHNR